MPETNTYVGKEGLIPVHSESFKEIRFVIDHTDVVFVMTLPAYL